LLSLGTRVESGDQGEDAMQQVRVRLVFGQAALE
jgi:hypothetical protein